MKTNEYVKQFKLDRENYNFNREKFMEAFGQESNSIRNVASPYSICT